MRSSRAYTWLSWMIIIAITLLFLLALRLNLFRLQTTHNKIQKQLFLSLLTDNMRVNQFVSFTCQTSSSFWSLFVAFYCCSLWAVTWFFVYLIIALRNSFSLRVKGKAGKLISLPLARQADCFKIKKENCELLIYSVWLDSAPAGSALFFPLYLNLIEKRKKINSKRNYFYIFSISIQGQEKRSESKQLVRDDSNRHK